MSKKELELENRQLLNDNNQLRIANEQHKQGKRDAQVVRDYLREMIMEALGGKHE